MFEFLTRRRNIAVLLDRAQTFEDRWKALYALTSLGSHPDSIRAMLTVAHTTNTAHTSRRPRRLPSTSRKFSHEAEFEYEEAVKDKVPGVAESLGYVRGLLAAM